MTTPVFIFLLLIIALCGAELVIRSAVLRFKRRFQWLITIADEFPIFTPDRTQEFFETRYDPDLGWAPKPCSKGTESTGSLGALSGHGTRVTFTIDSIGARANKPYSHLPSIISVYGDSYAFCRQVSDNETWPWYLSQLTRTNVINFGVGGYGIDQAFLRLKREYVNTASKLVILQFVPETIARIHSVWRHYFEYGNIFAFKPRFVISNGELALIPNPNKGSHSLYDIKGSIESIRAHDAFYHTKFLKFAYRSPYIFSFLQHPVRHGMLLSQLLVRDIGRPFGITYEGPWRTVLRDNLHTARLMYESQEATQLLVEIVKAFVAFSQVQQFTPVVLLLPYEYDVDYYQRYRTTYYTPVLREISEIVTTLDATELLSSASVTTPLYTNPFYGNHLTAMANKLVAEFVAEELEKLKPEPNRHNR